MAEGIGVEEGMLWLPKHVFDEPCDQEKGTGMLKPQIDQCHGRVFKTPTAEKVYPKQMEASYMLRTQRTRSPGNWAAGGPGMRAVFLDSGKKSTGTGVFLPRTAGSDFRPSSKRAACSPVLLPSRVVQALNLNVDELGLQIKPQRDTNKNLKGGQCNKVNNNKDKDKDITDQNCSPEIFLPKEWTY